MSIINEKKDATPDTEETQLSSAEEGSVTATALRHGEFSVLSLLGMGYSICNTGLTCIGSLSASLTGGGPIVFVWGQLLVFVLSLAVACSLGELSSAMPHAGGQAFWASQLAPPKMRRFASYSVGFLSWAGAVVTGASACLAISQMVFGMVILYNDTFVVKSWMVFVGFQITNALVLVLNLREKLIPTFNLASMYFSVITLLVIFITLLAGSYEKTSAAAIFATVDNFTGWADGVAFIIALSGPNWGFACLDAVTHMAEEVPDPRRTIPKALLATVFIGILTGFPFMIGVMFCVSDIESIVGTATGVASLQLFYNALNSKVGACVLQTMMVLVFVGALYGIHTWQSRIAWSFARSRGWPFSDALAKTVPAPLDVPVLAHLWSCAWISVLGCLYLGSTLAFNSLISGGILLQYLSYSSCVILLLVEGRGNLARGPFFLGRLGLLANIVLISWTLLTLAFYCMPSTDPTTAGTMNYVSCVIVFMFCYAIVSWFGFAKRQYVCPEEVK